MRPTINKSARGLLTPVPRDTRRSERTGPRLGLLGGSFNPAHAGHLHLSRQALARLRLDGIWWLVSPQNPLKPEQGMASFEDRLDAARAVAADPRIAVTGIEAELGTRYTADTLERLSGRFPNHRFVWLMGADNLIQIPDWERWPQIFRTVPVAVFARPSYSLRALAGPAERMFRHARVPQSRAAELADLAPPAWVFCSMPLDPTSASAIRAAGESWPR